MAGGLHGGGHGGVPDHGAVLQRGPTLGRDEHQCGLVPAGAGLRHVSSRWLFTITVQLYTRCTFTSKPLAMNSAVPRISCVYFCIGLH